MKIYYCTFPSFHREGIFGQLCIDTTPTKPYAICLFYRNRKFELQREHLTEYSPAWYRAKLLEIEEYQAKISYIRLCQSGAYGYKRQVEYTEPESSAEYWDKQIDKYSEFIHELRAEEQEFTIYTWLLNAVEYLKTLTEEQRNIEIEKQRKDFFELPWRSHKTSFGDQLDLQLQQT